MIETLNMLIPDYPGFLDLDQQVLKDCGQPTIFENLLVKIQESGGERHRTGGTVRIVHDSPNSKRALHLRL